MGSGGSKSKPENGNNNAGGSATQKSTTQGDNSNKSEQINYVKDSAATTSNAKSDAKTLTTSSGSKSAYKTGSEMSQKDSPVEDKQGVKMDRVILPPINVPPPGTEPTKEDNSLANVDNKTQTASSSPKEAVNVASDSKEVVTSNQSTTSSDAKQSQTKDTKQKHKDEEQVGFKQHLNNILTLQSSK